MLSGLCNHFDSADHIRFRAWVFGLISYWYPSRRWNAPGRVRWRCVSFSPWEIGDTKVLSCFFMGSTWFNLYKSKFWICWIRSTLLFDLFFRLNLSLGTWASKISKQPRLRGAHVLHLLLLIDFGYYYVKAYDMMTPSQRDGDSGDSRDSYVFFVVFLDGSYSFCSVDLHSKILGHVIF